ncbi:TerB N-terminal domain-containing protein [bacterium]|nr:TerB N-terminal domain-containing protein [bacterium]
MLLAELTAYAREQYRIEEQHRWADLPGLSVLCHPATGRWIALLMRQWDGEQGREIEVCDLKCGAHSLPKPERPYISAPVRMRGPKWISVTFNDETEPEVVFGLFDLAMVSEEQPGCTVVLDPVGSDAENAYRDTPLPFAGNSGQPAPDKLNERTFEQAAASETAAGRSVVLAEQRGVMLRASEAKPGGAVVSPFELTAGEGVYRDIPLPFVGNGGQPADADLPEKLREMPGLFSSRMGQPAGRAEAFYRQAKFMEDYEDDVPWSGEFFSYFPTYRELRLKQLRGYFSWRARLRKGDYQPISTSAAYIYVYELLNGIGADSPEDALRKLREFERGYLDSGIGEAGMRANLRRWMLELAVVSDIEPEKARQYADPELLETNRALAVLKEPENHSDAEVFEALCGFAGKKPPGAPVMAAVPDRGLRLFAEVWRRAAAGYRYEGRNLFTLCFGARVLRRWYPLGNAVYYWRNAQKDRDYALDGALSYRCRDGKWQVKSYAKDRFDRERIKSLLHETDLKLRRYLKTGRYLRENPQDAWADPFIEAAIEADRQAVIEASRPRIEIDMSSLDRIRADALTTRDSLLTESELADGEEAPSWSENVPGAEDARMPGPENREGAGTPLPESGKGAEGDRTPLPGSGEGVEDVLPPLAENAQGAEDVSPTLAESRQSAEDAPGPNRTLNGALVQILRALLRGRDAGRIVRENRLTPSMAADAINEALYDEIGDIAVECGDNDRLCLVEDYIDELSELAGDI